MTTRMDNAAGAETAGGGGCSANGDDGKGGRFERQVGTRLAAAARQAKQ